MNNIQDLLQFQGGQVSAPTPLVGAGTITGIFSVFQVWDSATQISSITINGVEITAFSAIVLNQGFCVYGYITSVTITAGAGLGIAGSK